MLSPLPLAESFTEDERRRLAPYFTNLDSHIFALTNLPETVKGALFARYSRSAKSLRRLFLDEFADKVAAPVEGALESGDVGVARAEKLFDKVFNEYGDDSVAQLGGAHIACEYVSNVLTKALEWGRLMAYLEQSTRYVPYTDTPQRPLALSRARRDRGNAARGALRLDDGCGVRDLREAGSAAMQDYFAKRYPRSAADSEAVHRSAIRAKALDTLRGMLPAATQSNVGIYGTGQAFEALLLRLRASPLAEARDCADRMLVELRKVIPAFLVSVDQPDRGGRWSDYLRDTRERTAALAATLVDDVSARTAGRGHADGLRSRRRGQDRRRGALRPSSLPDEPAADDRPRTVDGGPRRRAPRLRRRARPTAGIGPAARSSAPAIVSTSSRTTARSAICSAIGC